MKGIALAVVIIALSVGAIMFGCPIPDNDNSQFLRVHIRADSNDYSAQAVKYAVKNAVTEYLTPYLSTCSTKAQAVQTVRRQLDKIVEIADVTLLEKGFDYKATAKITAESFPTRSYDGFVLGSGVYDALIIELGSGKGDNWWCVVYPPLCFVGGDCNGTNAIRYKSKLVEIVNNFKLSQALPLSE